MAKSRDWNVVTRAYHGEALFGIRGDEDRIISQHWDGYLSALIKTPGAMTPLSPPGENIPFFPDDVAIVQLFLGWLQGHNPGQGITPARYFVSDHDKQCGVEKQDCAQTFLRYGPVLPLIDDVLVRLAHRFIGAKSGNLAEVDDETIGKSTQLAWRAVRFASANSIGPVPLFVTKANPQCLPTHLSRDTVWITARENGEAIDTQLIISLLISFIFLKQGGRDPFNQMRYIGAFNPWRNVMYRWDMQAFHPGVYNALINVINY